jgi:hypothetical protein
MDGELTLIPLGHRFEHTKSFGFMVQQLVDLVDRSLIVGIANAEA